jgi:isoquinoline 1-oxidoreductase subunit beta
VHAAVAVESGRPHRSDLKPPLSFELSSAQSAVAVNADHYRQARTAPDAMPVEWDDGPGARKVASIQSFLQAPTELSKTS